MHIRKKGWKRTNTWTSNLFDKKYLLKIENIYLIWCKNHATNVADGKFESPINTTNQKMLRKSWQNEEECTAWTVNDVLVDPYPFLFWSIHILFTAMKGYGSTKTKKDMDQPRRHWRSTLYVLLRSANFFSIFFDMWYL